jgi:hypothetical protein
MAQNTNAGPKLRAFINKLASLGYGVREVRKNPQIYSINDELVNIRSRSKHRNAAYGRSFWYDISFSVLHEVKWVIYLTTESDYFVKLPSSFLESIKDRMYLPRNKAGVGVFDIDWDNLKIVLKQGELISIDRYYNNLIEQECYPEF